MRQPPDRIAVTENLALRRLTVDDAEELQAAIDASRSHLEPFLPFASRDPANLEFRRRWIVDCNDTFEAGQSFSYGVVFDDELIGGCSIDPKEASVASIGYWIHVDHTRRGHATAVARALTRAAIRAGFTTVRLRHDRANTASGAIAQRLGFASVRREPHSIDAPGQTGETLIWELAVSSIDVTAVP